MNAKLTDFATERALKSLSVDVCALTQHLEQNQLDVSAIAFGIEKKRSVLWVLMTENSQPHLNQAE